VGEILVIKWLPPPLSTLRVVTKTSLFLQTSMLKQLPITLYFQKIKTKQLANVKIKSKIS
jgi:hypothetical protein